MRKKKWVYGRTREQVHDKWIKLPSQALNGPVTTSAPTLAEYYETFVRVHIVPALGAKRLGRPSVRDIQQWINRRAVTCQCCAQHETCGAQNAAQTR
jgi:hypothetical protein